MKTCPTCKKEFEPKTSWAKYCGLSCYKEAHRTTYEDWQCSVCGKVVSVNTKLVKDKKYCSLACCWSMRKGHRGSCTRMTDDERKIRLTARSIKWQKENKIKNYVAQTARVNNHLLTVIYECKCSHPKKHNHHFDYSRPLDVLRLCPDCHAKEHKRLRSLSAKAEAI